MNFMDDTDFLLLMAHNETRTDDFNKKNYKNFGYKAQQYVLTVQDRKRLYDVGMRTAHEQPAWQSIEPSKGEYNFDYLDMLINRNREAGLKSLMQIHGWRIPYWMPDEWKAKTEDGIIEEEVLSLWNKEAQEHGDKLYKTLDEHYWNDKDVAFFFGEWWGGEYVYPDTWCVYDDAAIDDYIRIFGTSAWPEPDTPEMLYWFGKKATEHFIHRAELLYPKFHEVWNMQQFVVDKYSKAYGNFIQLDLYRAYRKLWPDGCIVSCQCSYFDELHTKDSLLFIDFLKELTKCEVIVEAHYCAGLPKTTPVAIAKGFRGQLVRPAYENGATFLKDSHVENIKNSYNLWRKHYEDSLAI